MLPTVVVAGLKLKAVAEVHSHTVLCCAAPRCTALYNARLCRQVQLRAMTCRCTVLCSARAGRGGLCLSRQCCATSCCEGTPQHHTALVQPCTGAGSGAVAVAGAVAGANTAISTTTWGRPLCGNVLILSHFGPNPKIRT